MLDERDREREGAAFPRRREHELAVVARQRGGAVHHRDLVGERGHSRSTPIIESRVTTRDQLVLGEPVGAGRSFREHEVAHLGARVPHADLDVVGHRRAHLLRAARAARAPRASGRRAPCTTWAAGRAWATGSTSTACTRRGCAPARCSRRRPCGRPRRRRSRAPRSRRCRRRADARLYSGIDPRTRHDLGAVERAEVVLEVRRRSRRAAPCRTARARSTPTSIAATRASTGASGSGWCSCSWSCVGRGGHASSSR